MSEGTFKIGDAVASLFGGTLYPGVIQDRSGPGLWKVSFPAFFSPLHVPESSLRPIASLSAIESASLSATEFVVEQERLSREAKEKDETVSPRPWRLNPDWDEVAGMGVMPSPILDANGDDVISPSEWLNMRSADIDIIIAAVNAETWRQEAKVLSNAIDDIAAERRRQVEEEGWTTEHDDAHANGELAKAAVVYACNAADSDLGRQWPDLTYWPWAHDWWKPTTRRRDLVKAAALIVAEIERVDRLAHASNGTPATENRRATNLAVQN